MTDRRFALAQHLLETKPWSLFAMVEMGHDRMHGFWKYMDPEHRKHEPGNPYERAILDYHRHLDGLIETPRARRRGHRRLRPLGPRRETARRRNPRQRVAPGEGLLTTLEEPTGVSSLRDVGVDWSRTTAWGRAATTRVFLNVAGREPEGMIPPAEYEAVRDDLARRIAAIPDDAGNPIPTGLQAGGAVRRAAGGRTRPHRRLRRSPLAVGRDDRRRRRGIQTLENDTGPDDANHAQDGLYVVAGPGIEASGRRDAHLLDIAPTVLEILGIEEPAGLRVQYRRELVRLS